jgi:hypothetical protein
MHSHFLYYVNSRNRASGTTSNFTVNIEMPGGTSETFDSICVIQASIPKSYYLIDTGRNQFNLSETTPMGTSTAVIQIDPGNYTRRSLASYLQVLLNSGSPNGFKYVVAIPDYVRGPDTGKFLFQVTLGNGNPLPLNQQPYFTFGATSSPADQMGFLQNTVHQFVNGQLLSVNICNLQLDEAVYIVCPQISNGNLSVLQEIYASSPDFSMMQYDVGNSGGILANRKILTAAFTNSLHFVIMNSDREELNLNGINVCFSILVWNSEHYKPPS